MGLRARVESLERDVAELMRQHGNSNPAFANVFNCMQPDHIVQFERERWDNAAHRLSALLKHLGLEIVTIKESGHVEVRPLPDDDDE